MAAFPTLIPNQIAFDYGVANVSEYSARGLGPIRFRHSNYINNQSISLVYRGLNQTQIESIRAHYISVSGTNESFTVPVAVLGGANVATNDSTYRYAETPTEQHTGLHYNVQINLRVLKSTLVRFTLDGGSATLPAEVAFDEAVFSGTAPFILNGTDSTTATLTLNATPVS